MRLLSHSLSLSVFMCLALLADNSCTNAAGLSAPPEKDESWYDYRVDMQHYSPYLFVLPPGYSHKEGYGSDITTGHIFNPGGLNIFYQIGGWSRAHLTMGNEYINCREYEFAKRTFLLGFPKKQPNVCVIAVPARGTVFSSTVKNEDEVQEMLQIVSTFNPHSSL